MSDRRGLVIGEVVEDVLDTVVGPGDAIVAGNGPGDIGSNNVVHTGLVELGFIPPRLSETLIGSMFEVAERYKHRVDRDALLPLVNWRRTANRIRPL
jgi:UDP-sulfoquinovose synthase